MGSPAAAIRCACCPRPIAARDLLCPDCWALGPAPLKREFLRAAARAGRWHGTRGWRDLSQTRELVAAVAAKRADRTARVRDLNPELF